MRCRRSILGGPSHYWWTCKVGYLEATVHFGLKHEEFGDEFSNYLRNIARED